MLRSHKRATPSWPAGQMTVLGGREAFDVKVTGPYDIEAVRGEWIGREGDVSVGRYPVEHDPIRRHCHMVEDTNPLFLDPEFAAGTRHGAVVAPPVMADSFAGGGAWPRAAAGRTMLLDIPTPGDRLINMNQEIDFVRPVKVGDRLSSRPVVVDIVQKPIRLDPAAVWITVETRVTNQDDEVVARYRNTLLVHREPDEVAADA